MKSFILELLGILFVLFNMVVAQNSCSVSLNCQNTFCCKNSICVESSICYNDTKIVYIIVGCMGIFLLILTIVYYIFSSLETNESMKKYSEANKKNNNIEIKE